jgi:hypothetical protein
MSKRVGKRGSLFLGKSRPIGNEMKCNVQLVETTATANRAKLTTSASKEQLVMKVALGPYENPVPWRDTTE